MALPANYLLFHNDRDIDVKGTIPGQQSETQQKVCRETKKMHPGAVWYPQENQAVFRGGGTETSVIKENRSSSWKISGQTLSPPVQFKAHSNRTPCPAIPFVTVAQEESATGADGGNRSRDMQFPRSHAPASGCSRWSGKNTVPTQERGKQKIQNLQTVAGRHSRA